MKTIYGSGILWSGAHQELLRFVEISKIPCLPTPLARGCVPDDHPLSCFTSRWHAMSGWDVILFIGARLNFILNYGRPLRFSPQTYTIQVDLSGDGAFGFNGMVMDTAARRDIPIVVVISNNTCWGICMNAQKSVFGADRTFGTLLSHARYDLSAKSLDC